MEGRRQKHLSSCSSLVSDSPMSKGSPIASSGGRSKSSPSPATMCLGKESLHSPEAERVNGSGSENEPWSSKSDVSGHKKSSVKDVFEQYPVDEAMPFHYSSSIYYGAQDVYFQTETSYTPTVLKNGGGEDLNSALRGNWFQGSLYY